MTISTLYPAVSSDDGYKYGTFFYTNFFYLNAGLYLSNDNSLYIRFPNCPVEKGADIPSATLTLTGFSTRIGAQCNIRVCGVAADNPDAPTTAIEYDALPTTECYDINAVPSSFPGTTYQINVTQIISAVTSRPGYASGNAIMLLIKNNNSSNMAYRTYSSVDNTDNPEYKPKLDIDWSVSIDFNPHKIRNVSEYQVILTGAADGVDDAVLKVGSMNLSTQLQWVTIIVTDPDGGTYEPRYMWYSKVELQAVWDTATQISERPNGELVINYIDQYVDDVPNVRELFRGTIDKTLTNEGANDRSLTVEASYQDWPDAEGVDTSDISFTKVSFRSPNSTEGRWTYNIPKPVTGMTPGRYGVYAGDSHRFQIGEIQYIVSGSAHNLYLKEGLILRDWIVSTDEDVPGGGG